MAQEKKFWQLFNLEDRLILAHALVVNEDDRFYYVERSHPRSFGMRTKLPRDEQYPDNPQEAIRGFLEAVLRHKKQLVDTLKAVDGLLLKTAYYQKQHPDPEAPEEHAQNLESHAAVLSAGGARQG